MISPQLVWKYSDIQILVKNSDNHAHGLSGRGKNKSDTFCRNMG